MKSPLYCIMLQEHKRLADLFSCVHLQRCVKAFLLGLLIKDWYHWLIQLEKAHAVVPIFKDGVCLLRYNSLQGQVPIDHICMSNLMKKWDILLTLLVLL